MDSTSLHCETEWGRERSYSGKVSHHYERWRRSSSDSELQGKSNLLLHSSRACTDSKLSRSSGYETTETSARLSQEEKDWSSYSYSTSRYSSSVSFFSISLSALHCRTKWLTRSTCSAVSGSLVETWSESLSLDPEKLSLSPSHSSCSLLKKRNVCLSNKVKVQ